MNKNCKKGFTIVELIIVIAVIAILAAVLIPTFSNLIKRANVANDTALVRNLNTALAADGAKQHDTMREALAAANAFGYDVSKINAKADDAAEKPNAEDSYTALRAAAEAKGYTVTWTSNKAPIKVTKGDITAEITIGSDAFTYTHMTRDIQPLDRMEKLSMPAALQEGKTMVPQSFIDALK